MEYPPSCTGPTVSLQGQEERWVPLASPPATSLLDGVGGGTYVEFFILCDNFSIGEDGGRRAFGEWISWKDKADKSL